MAEKLDCAAIQNADMPPFSITDDENGATRIRVTRTAQDQHKNIVIQAVNPRTSQVNIIYPLDKVTSSGYLDGVYRTLEEGNTCNSIYRINNITYIRLAVRDSALRVGITIEEFDPNTNGVMEYYFKWDGSRVAAHSSVLSTISFVGFVLSVVAILAFLLLAAACFGAEHRDTFKSS